MKKKLLSILVAIIVLTCGMQNGAYASETSEMYTGISSITRSMCLQGVVNLQMLYTLMQN